MKNYRSLLLFLSLATLPLFGVFFYRALSTEPTLPSLTEKADKAGEAMLADLRSLPAREIKEEKDAYVIEENGKDGIEISFANQAEAASPKEEKPKTTLSLPKDYGKPISIDLGEGKTVLITDLSGNKDYETGILSDGPSEKDKGSFLNRKSEDAPKTYLSYTSPDERTTHLYAYQKDQASGEKKLKSWTLYNYGLGKETESYKIENAKIKIDDGNAKVFFFGQNDIQSEQAKADVDPNLMDRAQRFLKQETGNDIMNDTDRTPDFTIPKPTYFTKDGKEKESDWKWDEDTKTLSVALTENPQDYPIALDPTLSFTAPGSVAGGSTITGENVNNYFGSLMIAGDLNADGRTDLVVSASEYDTGNLNVGRIYVFYNDGSYTEKAASADAIITDSLANSYFGRSLAVGDFNFDGKTDLAVGATGNPAFTGRAYIFYNDGSYPADPANADVIIAGESNSRMGRSMSTGDFNSDGRVDLAVGSEYYPNTNKGRVYIFYNDGSYPATASSADVAITGETDGDYFANILTSGDYDSNGKTDLVVGAYGYSTSAGRAYVFYNDGSFGTVACTTDCLASNADAKITGEASSNNFSSTFASGDFNADGKTDLAVGAYGYSTSTGRAYVFYGGSIATEGAIGADVIIGGASSSSGFGYHLNGSDLNVDGRTDLVVGASAISSSTNDVYVFYNDGSYPSTASTADVYITDNVSSYFGYSLVSGDFNSDGKTDLVVGGTRYSIADYIGRVYILYSQNGTVNTNKSIAGESTNQDFGRSFAAGDFNADGKTDLAVGAENYDTGSSNVGRVYVFYNDGSYPTGGASADAIIEGEAASNLFGSAISVGDFNADGKTDLAVGAYGYSTSTGRAYVFYNGSITTENASGADIIITGEVGSDAFGKRISSGDLNADGKTDLVVGASGYSSSSGRIYVFNNDGSYPTGAGSADTFITGASNKRIGGAGLLTADLNADGKIDLAAGSTDPGGGWSYVHIFYNDGSYPTGVGSSDVTISDDLTQDFGAALAAGDFNTDGRVDLAVGGTYFSGGSYGHAFIFWNDGSYPTTRATADINIRAEATSDSFGQSLVAGDFNADGKTDLAVGAYGVTTNTGKAYIFHNDGSSFGTVTCTTDCLAANADVIITGETTSNYFGAALVSGDFNADGRTDLVVGAYGNSTNTGKIYFYETRENFAWTLQPVSGLRTSPNFSGEEMKISGEIGTTGQFGNAFATGDFNADGKTDLAVGASAYNSNAGRVFLFYNDGSISSGAPSADAIISGESSSSFGKSLVAGDFNADGKIDLAAGASGYSSSNGRAYIFYQDGSIPATAATADAIITGESGSLFGFALAAGDFNADGKTDLAVGAYTFYGGSGDTGRAYLFYNGAIITEAATGADTIITGDGTFRRFGYALVSGDFDADGDVDLAVGAYDYPGNGPGRVYLFWNDGSYPSVVSSADVVVSGESDGNNPVYFGTALAAGDFNADGKTDLVVGSYSYSYTNTTGRSYIFYADGTNNFGTVACSGTPAACSAANADVIITGESGSAFGITLVSGDFNADGRTDLAVGGSYYSTNTGRTYVFYNDGSIPTTAATADLILQGGATGNYYGAALAAGDLNADGKTDLAVGAYGYNSSQGCAYLYTFNDGVITGEATGNYFSEKGGLITGDFNQDGKTDLAVGAYGYSSDTGRVYLFYNDGSYPTTAASADVIITGEAGSCFGDNLIGGDFNQDGRTDFTVGASCYSSNAGRAYIFYNDGSIPTTAASADVIITGEAGSGFSWPLGFGDCNSDGRVDLVVGAWQYSSSAGRVYVFYNDGSIPTTAATADVIITGEASSSFSYDGIASGDFNQDGRTDLAVGATGYSSGVGRVYVFYNDGSIPTTAATADVIITGETTGNNFGWALSAADFNQDGKTDLAVSAFGYLTSTGRAYIFHNDGSIPTTAATADVIIQGEATNNSFGYALSSGDFNQDGKLDLAVGATGYSSNTGRAYVFYNDGSYPTAATSADVIIQGGAANNYFGGDLMGGDFNSDGKTDLAVSAHGHASITGRVYIFITEAKAVASDQMARLRGSGKMKGPMRLR